MINVKFAINMSQFQHAICAIAKQSSVLHVLHYESQHFVT